MSFDPFSHFPKVDLESFQGSLKDIENLVVEVFHSEAGLKLLGHLEAITISRPSFLIGQEHYYGYFREGQNDLVRQLIHIMEKKYFPKAYKTALRSQFRTPKKRAWLKTLYFFRKTK